MYVYFIDRILIKQCLTDHVLKSVLMMAFFHFFYSFFPFTIKWSVYFSSSSKINLVILILLAIKFIIRTSTYPSINAVIVYELTLHYVLEEVGSMAIKLSCNLGFFFQSVSQLRLFVCLFVWGGGGFQKKVAVLFSPILLNSVQVL